MKRQPWPFPHVAIIDLEASLPVNRQAALPRTWDIIREILIKDDAFT